MGSQYVVTLDAVNSASGDTLAEVQARPDSKEQVLKALDQSTTLKASRHLAVYPATQTSAVHNR